jgi:hypothetical protein
MYEEIFRNLARAKTRDSLSNSASFLSLGLEEQKNLFRDLYRRNYGDLVTAHSGRPVVHALATETAGQMIDDKRHLNPRIEQAGELAGDFINEVDFPQFVKDLLKGVFDANLQVTIQQMEAYQKLLKTATESLAKFVNAIDDTAAFGYLAENQSDDFNLGFSPSEKNEDGSPKTILTNREGEPVDIGDNEVKSRIMDAKIKMAQEQRALLRETILMGITRLVVEKGNVKASVIFDIKASERINKTDQAAIKEQKSTSGSISGGGGLLAQIIFPAGPSGGYTSSSRKTKLSVSTAQSQSSTDLAAKVMGSVDITFKSDYFKLDNFAQMYGPSAATPGTPGAPGTPATPGAAGPPAALAPGGGR